jgi:hypothetical protein
MGGRALDRIKQSNSLANIPASVGGLVWQQWTLVRPKW